MIDFINTIFNAANAIPTGLMVFVLFYWLIVITGFLGTDFLDFDIDVESDIDVDTDMDIDTASADISWINHILVFFNLGKMPVMIWLSFLVFPLWLICINVNSLLGFSGFFSGLIIFFPALLISLFIAKFITWPFARFFQKIDEETKEKEVLGRIGIVTIPADDISNGQAEINHGGSFLRMSIRTSKHIKVTKGQKVLFVQPFGDRGVYLVEPYAEMD
ncbi:DUF1449 family protein [Cryomorphaceae bacterium 1068]|nr:DUF1449 family protein [Cryomorphaceae bacterium 1068]